MKKIYSKFKPGLLLTSILHMGELTDLRVDLSPCNEILQASRSILKKNFKLKAHKHKKLLRKTEETQEAWLVYKGKINVRFFDIDNTEIHSCQMSSGDCALIFRGGHDFIVLEENTIFFEFKNGPYYGSILDREEFNDKKNY